MIEREFVKDKIKYMNIIEELEKKIRIEAGSGSIEIEKTPLGERVTINAVKPGLVIGRGGKTIDDLTKILKFKYKLENPQIEVREVVQPNLSSSIVAKRIVSTLTRFGASRFRAVGYRALADILRAGAMGVEIIIGGRGVPGSRANSWRFYGGYIKKCGYIADHYIDSSYGTANLKTGSVGVKVSIMLPNTPLPDKIIVKEPEIKVEEVAPQDSKKFEEEVEKIEAVKGEEIPKKEKKEKVTKKKNIEKAEKKEAKEGKSKEKKVTKKKTTKKIAKKVKREENLKEEKPKEKKSKEEAKKEEKKLLEKVSSKVGEAEKEEKKLLEKVSSKTEEVKKE